LYISDCQQKRNGLVQRDVNRQRKSDRLNRITTINDLAKQYDKKTVLFIEFLR
jgi:hypothetical protein